MKPGQRIKLIMKIAENITKYNDWVEIDLIFRQFEVRTTDSWNGDKRSYAITMSEYADDNKLIELNDFLIDEMGEKEEGIVVTLTKSVSECWQEGLVHLFISHSSKNKGEVSELKIALRRYKISAFVAHEDIQPTEEWQEEILCGLDTCDALVAWSTTEFELSAFAQQEVGIVIEKRKVILTVRRGVDPVGFTAKQQGIPGNQEIKDIAKDIVKILMKKPSLQNKIQETLISSLEHSRSYEDAKEKMDLLEEFKDWNPDQLKRIGNAIKSAQVLGAYGVPERIRGLVKKFTPESSTRVKPM